MQDIICRNRVRSEVIERVEEQAVIEGPPPVTPLSLGSAQREDPREFRPSDIERLPFCDLIPDDSEALLVFETVRRLVESVPVCCGPEAVMRREHKQTSMTSVIERSCVVD